MTSFSSSLMAMHMSMAGTFPTIATPRRISYGIPAVLEELVVFSLDIYSISKGSDIVAKGTQHFIRSDSWGSRGAVTTYVQDVTMPSMDVQDEKF